MKSRFHIGIFVVVLTLLGVFSGQQEVAPNQEIVLQFSDVEVTSSETEHAVASVAKQLEGLGVQAYQISEQEEGKIVISYYSEIDVVRIKSLLSKEQGVVLGLSTSNQNQDNSDFPTQNQAITYNLDVYEIQSSIDLEPNLNGSLVDLYSYSDQLLNPIVYSSNTYLDESGKNTREQIAYNVYKGIATAINNIPYVIPEVRAGPSAYSVS